MKIAIDTDILQIMGFPIGLNCGEYRNGIDFFLCDWEIGTVQNGSSGAPLFNSQKKVIGQLFAGCDCNSDYNEAFFGRLHISWEGGGTPDTRLKDWLDPKNTGVLTLDGIHMPNLKYGFDIQYGDDIIWNSYDDLKIGSSNISPFTVYNDGNLILKAGREIVIKPCTKILPGSNFLAYIQQPTCSDIISQSSIENNNPNICGNVPPKQAIYEDIFYLLPQSNIISITPNPFSEETSIYIFLSRDERISLDIYDIYGKKIYTLVDNTLYKQNTYKFNFSSNNIGSGVYYVVLTTQTQKITKQIVLVK